MNKNAKIKIRNRSTGMVVYTIQDLGIRREFTANEIKEVSFEEIQKLSYQTGGKYMLENYLIIENLDAREEILGAVELEYDYTEEQVKSLLLYGSLDSLLDCLDFAPKGVIDLVKKLAVDLEVSDTRKRRAIQNATGFNVDGAIKINEETKEAVDENETPVRRVAVTEATNVDGAVPARRIVVKK